jgi:hypothetical protein
MRLPVLWVSLVGCAIPPLALEGKRCSSTASCPAPYQCVYQVGVQEGACRVAAGADAGHCTQPFLRESFEMLAEGTTWAPGEVKNGWKTFYQGNGAAGIVVSDGSKKLQASQYAALMSVDPVGDLDLIVTEKTLSADPDYPSDVAQVFWHFQDPSHYYRLAIRRSGWDLLRQAPAGPVFLDSGLTPVFPEGVAYQVRVRQVGGVISAWIDGQALFTTPDATPYDSGSVGLGADGTKAEFDDLQVCAP